MKIKLFILTLACALAVTGCTLNENEAIEKSSENNIQQASQNDWGITLKAENVTPKGLTVICEQSGGENVAELDTGSYYFIQRYDEEWTNVEYLPQEYDIGWTSEAWIITKDSSVSWDIDWEWLYGKLPAGKYRIGKEIMNFRESGDYDKETVYAEFIIE